MSLIKLLYYKHISIDNIYVKLKSALHITILNFILHFTALAFYWSHCGVNFVINQRFF
jgi:hypothetical protein